MFDKEFLQGFEVLFNNVTSNQAPGLNVYEISWFLTKAQSEIVKNHFTANSKGNNIAQGFDDSAKRQADFSMLMKTANCESDSALLVYTLDPSEDEWDPDSLYNTLNQNSVILTDTNGNEVEWGTLPQGMENPLPFRTKSGDAEPTLEVGDTEYKMSGDAGVQGIIINQTNAVRIDSRSNTFKYPSDVFLIINEIYKVNGETLQVVPLKYDAYMNLMSKPFKRPLKNQAWRLINSGDFSTEDNAYTRNVEIIAGPGTDNITGTYIVRYVRKPKPIIVDHLDGLTIDGYCYTGDNTSNAEETKGCELDPSIHDEILQRAVELAKVAWTATGQDNTNSILQAGQRSE